MNLDKFKGCSPGPWSLQWDDDKAVGHLCVKILNSKGEDIFEACDEEYYPWVTHMSRADYELAVAAPELLAEVERLRELLKDSRVALLYSDKGMRKTLANLISAELEGD